MDLQVIYLRDVLPLTAADNVPGLTPRTLELRGPDFSSVAYILINDVDSPSFVVPDSTKIYAQVPEAIENDSIHSISVVSGKFTRTDASRVLFGLTDRPRLISGVERMVQAFLMLLMTTPGTDAWTPKRGGGLQKILGGHFSRRDTGSVVAEFSVAVNRTKTQMIAVQTTNQGLQEDERLASVDILQSVFDPGPKPSSPGFC